MAKKPHYIGLSDAEVAASRQQHGANVLTPVEKAPWWRKLLEKFRDPLITILLVAGVMSVAISFYEYYSLGKTAAVFYEPVGIFVAIALRWWSWHIVALPLATIRQEVASVLRAARRRQAPPHRC